MESYLTNLNPLETLAVITGLVCVWLTVKENIWCWPVGIVSVCCYAVIFFQVKLYADMGLQVIYIALSVYGWYEWLRGGKDHGELEVSQTTMRLHSVLAAIALVGTFVMGWSLSRYTDASLSYLDSAMAVLSLIAQWMMARKFLECWLVWISVNVFSIGKYFLSALYPTMALYAVFLVLAVMGYREWRTSLRSRQPA